MRSRCWTRSASTRRTWPAPRPAAACCRTSRSIIPTGCSCCIFSNTWVKADEYITRVQMTRKRIALAYGPEEYVKVSSLFTNGAMQFRYDLDKVMELERRALATVAPVEVLASGLDMTLQHDRTAELHKICNAVADRRHPRRCHRAVLSVRGPAQGRRGLPPRHRRGRRSLFLSPPLAGVEPHRSGTKPFGLRLRRELRRTLPHAMAESGRLW